MRYSAFVSSEATQITPRPIYKAEKPIRNEQYKRFIKRLPCVACLKTWGIDPCHTGPHGLSSKSSDLSCIPLCRRCHDAFDADPRGFAESEGLDIAALVARFNQLWKERIAA